MNVRKKWEISLNRDSYNLSYEDLVGLRKLAHKLSSRKAAKKPVATSRDRLAKRPVIKKV